MKISQKVKKALANLGYTKGEAEAAQVWKGHGREGYGWYLEPFGESPQWLGESWSEVEQSLDSMGEYRTMQMEQMER